MDNDSLMDEYREVMAELDPLVERRKLIEFHLQKNMENDGATEFVGSGGKAVIEKGSARSDHDNLDALYEYLMPHELAEAGAVVPAHTEEVPRKYNLTKLKPFARRGKEIAAIIEGAKEYSRGKLKVTTETNTLSVQERAND